MKKVSRRQMFGVLAGAAITGVITGLGTLKAAASTPPKLRAPLPRPRLLGAAESLQAGKAVLPTGQTGFGYNGIVPGPTIRIRQGEAFIRRVENQLDHATTVHWHGLLPPSEMDGQPHDEIASGTYRDYSFNIDQRAGLNWYHPHPHGATASQVWQGLAGFCVVEDDQEAALGLPSDDQELLLVLRDAPLQAPGILGYAADIAGTLGQIPLVNGIAWPRTSLARGFARLRLLNGANARVFTLVCDAPMTVIGNDGGLLNVPQPVDHVEMAPAERIDLLLDLRALAPGSKIALSCRAADWSLLEIEVTDAEVSPWEIPPHLSVIEPLLHEGPPDRTFIFEENETINGAAYDMNRIDFAVPFKTVERWRFVSARGAPHPVHIHGAHFQVQTGTGPNGSIRHIRPWERGWKDTVNVRTHESVDVLVRFDAHEGRYLLHCHKLEHEDHGMMMNFIVATDPVRAMEKASLEALYGPLCFAKV